MTSASRCAVLLAAAALTVAACTAPMLSVGEAAITIDARGVESGVPFDVVIMLVNDPTSVPGRWKDRIEGAAADDRIDIGGLTDPEGRLRTGRRKLGGDVGGEASRVASVAERLQPRSRTTRELETYSDCIHMFVAVRSRGKSEGEVFGPYTEAAFSRRTVRISGRRGDFDVLVLTQ